MEHAKRIGAPKYIPTTTDMLRARAKSVGIAETRYVCGHPCGLQEKTCYADLCLNIACAYVYQRLR